MRANGTEILHVEVWLESTSEPIIYEDAMAVYQKGDFLCVSYKKDGAFTCDKYPAQHIFRVRHTYTGKKDSIVATVLPDGEIDWSDKLRGMVCDIVRAEMRRTGRNK